MWKVLKRIMIYGPLILVTSALVVYLALPWPVRWRWQDPVSTSVMEYRERQARERGETLEIRHAWVPLDRISRHMRRAAIVAEDGRFHAHDGVDWLAVQDELEYDGEPPFSWTDPDDLAAAWRAVRYYWTHRDEVRGRSTITQQLAKNLYWTPERSLVRKVGEFFVARRLEWLYDKDRILEMYLNTVELGPGVFGVEAAARHYFGTSAAELTQWQAASLAATLPHPLTSNPDHRPGRMAWRRDRILARLQGRDAGLNPVPVQPEPVAAPDVEIEVPDVEPGEEGADPAPAEPQAADPPPDSVSPDSSPPAASVPDSGSPGAPGGGPAPEPAEPDTSGGTELAPPGAPRRG